MCAGALYWSKIGKVVYGAADEKNGYLRITKENSPFHPKTEVIRGIMKEECGELIKSFFHSKR
jgi:tRNA(adenine34) deaminase